MRRLLTLLTFVLFVGAALGQQPREAFRERLRRDDANGDGKVTRAEFSGPARLFDRLDRNGDGTITSEEMDAVRRQSGAARQQAVPDDVELIQDVVFGKGGGTDLKLDIVRPKDIPSAPMPVLVFIHGGGWKGGDKRTAVRKLIPFAQNGYLTATINYRLTGIASFPAQIEDCKCAIRFLRANAEKYNLDPGRIGVWGSSAGGHLVALLGTSGGADELEGTGGWPDHSSRVQAVCDWYGPSDLTKIAQAGTGRHSSAESPVGRLLGGPAEARRERAAKASPVTYVSGDDPPFLIMHGTEDPVVPYSQSVILAEALQEAGVSVTLVPLEGAKHGGREFASPGVTRQVMAFFDRHLREARNAPTSQAPRDCEAE